MTPQPTDDDVLRDLHECQGSVNVSEFNAAEKRALRQLEKDGFVALRWVITPRGIDHLKKTFNNIK